MVKRELRLLAETLRRQGLSVPAIATELGVARSTAFRWTMHIPREGPAEAVARRKAHAKAMTDSRWAEHRVQRDTEHAEILAASAAEVGQLSDREILLIGAAIYWSQGTKSKPWRPNDWRLTFTNTDVGLVAFFLRFLAMLGQERHALIYRLSIHASADVEAAKAWWIERLDLPGETHISVTLKRHNPSPGRHNAGADYHGCFVVRVRQSTRLYRRIEGIVNGLLGGG